MAFCTVTDNPAGSRDLYEQVIQRIRETGPFPPEGTIFHIAGPHESGWRVINVWESREAAERFVNDRLNPAFQHLGAEPPAQVSAFEVHRYMAGNLSPAVPA